MDFTDLVQKVKGKLSNASTAEEDRDIDDSVVAVLSTADEDSSKMFFHLFFDEVGGLERAKQEKQQQSQASRQEKGGIYESTAPSSQTEKSVNYLLDSLEHRAPAEELIHQQRSSSPVRENCSLWKKDLNPSYIVLLTHHH
ncbi:hypothetical protein NHQ30_008490 [Ciborinia camelliae]|nr:hypothetical protein NHQ30_008490 [Ciborinia camelliae]